MYYNEEKKNKLMASNLFFYEHLEGKLYAATIMNGQQVLTEKAGPNLSSGKSLLGNDIHSKTFRYVLFSKTYNYNELKIMSVCAPCICSAKVLENPDLIIGLGTTGF